LARLEYKKREALLELFLKELVHSSFIQQVHHNRENDLEFEYNTIKHVLEMNLTNMKFNSWREKHPRNDEI
jgi:hypothetical protein